jgi:hypothetical protein
MFSFIFSVIWDTIKALFITASVILIVVGVSMTAHF